MKTISKEEVLKIAKLARLELTDKEVEKMQKDLSPILDYFDALKNAPKIAIGNEKITSKNSFRLDEVVGSDSVDEIIQAFPDKKDNYIKVKQIL
jgi:aspartyl-tRNA(Asn)/glutamyl-tRNA(Gln) amidotransferase subunit C